MQPARSQAALDTTTATTAHVVTVFVCTNCARGGAAPTSASRRRPSPPRFDWPFSAYEVVVPCAGRLQPEHVLKVFEAGAEAVCVIACEETNCHYLEGSRRCRRRVEYLGQLLDQVGLGAERLMLFHLPGSATQDMALGLSAAERAPEPRLEEQVAEVRRAVVTRLAALRQNPLHQATLPEKTVGELDDDDASQD